MRLIKGFTPNWFTAGMGTGIVALDAYLLPAGPQWMKTAGTSLWFLNMALVGTLIVLMGLRGIVDPRGVKRVFTDPLHSMFFGAIPMAMTTVVNGFFDMGPHLFGAESYHIGAVLWVVNAAIAVASGFVVPFLMFISHDHALSGMTAVWLMPIVPAEVVAASSGLMLPHIANLALQQDLFVGTIVLWAFSVPMAFLLLGTLFVRLALHHLPPRELAISTWITLGTIGTGIMGLMLVAKDASLVYPSLAPSIAGTATFASIVFWGLGIWWLVHSFLITGYYLWTKTLRFNLGWWGLTFPLGVFVGGTDLLYHALGTGLFRGAALGFFVLLALFWLLVASLTVHHLTTLRRARKAPADNVSAFDDDEAVV